MKGIVRTSLLRVRVMMLVALVAFQPIFMKVMAGTSALTGDSTLPVPTGNVNQLFYLQRTPNSNTIVCELNYKNGVLVDEDPVHTFWLRFQEQGQRAELSYIQRKFAYGVKAVKTATEKYELHFVSYKKYKMYLQKAADNKFHVFTLINKQMSILKSIYVKINGGSFWVPNVEYVEVKGSDPVTGKEVTERFKV